MTGFFRSGTCDTCGDDRGMHVVCAEMTEAFLSFSVERGNNLIDPIPAYGFPGLKAGDCWCLCLTRWLEAYQAGVAPPVKLEATHASVLEFVDLKVLEQFAVS